MLRTAPPVDFDGPGDAWSPEQLLLGAVASCFAFTLRAVARASQVTWRRLDVVVEGTVAMEKVPLKLVSVTPVICTMLPTKKP